MRYGIGLHAGFPPDRFRAIVRLAEELGFSHVWVADEGLYRSPYAALAVAALSTTRVHLGTGVTNPYTRHPALTAAAIATVDELSACRTVLGLGAGGSAPLALGLPKPHPVEAVRDAIAIINGLTGSGEVDYCGQCYSFNGALDFRPLRRVPVYVGTRGPRLLRVAGEMADGVILGSLGTPRAVQAAMRHIQEGAKRAGRDPGAIRIVSWLATSISEDRFSAARAVSSFVAVATITSHKLIPETAQQLPHPVREELERQRWTRNSTTVEMVRRALTADLIDEFSLVGSLAAVRVRIHDLAALGLDQVSLLLVPPQGSTIEEQMRLFAGGVISDRSA